MGFYVFLYIVCNCVICVMYHGAYMGRKCITKEVILVRVKFSNRYCCRPPRLGPEHLNKKKQKAALLKVRLFSCFIVDLIVRSCVFTHIAHTDIVTLSTKEDFLHRVLLFLIISHKVVLSLQQISQ